MTEREKLDQLAHEIKAHTACLFSAPLLKPLVEDFEKRISSISAQRDEALLVLRDVAPDLYNSLHHKFTAKETP